MKFTNPIDKIKDILNDDFFSQMNLSNMKGFLGELYVKQKLELEGEEIEHRGKQSSVDLIIHRYNIHIDVKLSTQKYLDSKNKKIINWGWALRQASKKEVKCTHFVCIALSEDFDPVFYVVLKADDLHNFPGATGQFKNVKSTLVIANDFNEVAGNEIIDHCHKLVDKGIAIKVMPDEKLMDRLKK